MIVILKKTNKGKRRQKENSLDHKTEEVTILSALLNFDCTHFCHLLGPLLKVNVSALVFSTVLCSGAAQCGQSRAAGAFAVYRTVLRGFTVCIVCMNTPLAKSDKHPAAGGRWFSAFAEL